MASKGRVLIVEDEAVSAMALAWVLRRLGYDIWGPVATGEQALSLIESVKPNLVLMDILLAGDIDGVDAAETIRQTSDVPVVFMTGYLDKDTLERIGRVTCSSLVTKPYDLDTVGGVVEQWLEPKVR